MKRRARREEEADDIEEHGDTARSPQPSAALQRLLAQLGAPPRRRRPRLAPIVCEAVPLSVFRAPPPPTQQQQKQQQQQQQQQQASQTKKKAPVETKTPLKSALKRPGSADGGRVRTRREQRRLARRHSVCFDRVQIREYERLHDGSGGVPRSGTYALGLGWAYREDAHSTRPLAEYERERARVRTPWPVPLSAPRRRALLERLDPAHAADGAAGTRTAREMRALLHSRSAAASCACAFGACAADTCACHEAHMPCVPGMCACTTCCNPYAAFDTITPQSAARARARRRRAILRRRARTPPPNAITVTDVPE